MILGLPLTVSEGNEKMKAAILFPDRFSKKYCFMLTFGLKIYDMKELFVFHHSFKSLSFSRFNFYKVEKMSPNFR